jgi:maleate isomerase
VTGPVGRRIRIGLVVPSSNTTMETELPELFSRREGRAPERFSFHASRMRMTAVTPEALAAMNDQGARCAAELADAGCDALAYACLVAVMAAGRRAHITTEQRLRPLASDGGRAPFVTSAGALAAGIDVLGARRVALIAPYAPALTLRVVDYLADLGITVVDAISLAVTDNRAVGVLDPMNLVTLADRLDLRGAEAIVLSACVQMPSLPAIPVVEHRTGLPTLSAATATAHQLLTALDLQPLIPNAGALLADTDTSRRRARTADQAS